jgi:hypothetical protein
MNRRDRKAAVAKAKAEGMNRRDRKALGRKLKADNLITWATEEAASRPRILPQDLFRSDDWQAVGQRRQDLIEGLRRFNESELAAFIPRPRLRRKRDELFSEYSSDKYKLN